MTDPIAFEALLRRAGWTWADVVRWADERGDYVPLACGFRDLTLPQRVTLADHLSVFIAEKSVGR